VLRQRDKRIFYFRNLNYVIDFFSKIFSQFMQKIITSLTFNIFVKICFKRFKIRYKVVNVLQQLLLNVLIFSRKNKTTIF